MGCFWRQALVYCRPRDSNDPGPQVLRVQLRQRRVGKPDESDDALQDV